MNDQLPPFVQRFNDLIKECEIYISIARAHELQIEAINRLEIMQNEIEEEKNSAIARDEDDYANLLLGCSCVATALSAELKMWVLLKREQPEEAWDQLVAAQMASVDAVRAHEGFEHLEHHNKRLEAIEHLVFPPQVFISSGMIVRKQECSICGEEYEDCPHLVSKPYMGQFCYIIARDIELDHASIVEDPADKRCRVMNFSSDGITRNKMTWRVEPSRSDT